MKKTVQAFVDWLKMAPEIDLADQYVIDSVNALQAAGLIGAGRATEVLS